MRARDVLVGDDGKPRARLERRDAEPKRCRDAAADHDVVGAATKPDIHDRRFGGAQRGGHHSAASSDGRAIPSRAASSAMISLTIVSCATSRDITVMSAWA